jgi:hypothetical protein
VKVVYRESREDRNKRIAIEAITLLERAVAGDLTGEHLAAEVAGLHARWEQRGVDWTRPALWLVDTEEWLCANDMAQYLDVSAEQVRRWCYRGHITMRHNDGGVPVYNVGECVAYKVRRGTRPAID